MLSVKELLVDSLKELVEADLKEFQWRLKNDHKDISNSEMENPDRLKTVDKMVTCFGSEEAVKIMMEILRKMKQNDLAEQLETKHKRQESPVLNVWLLSKVHSMERVTYGKSWTMASVKELLVNSLKDLVEAELKEFQWHLQKDHECISKSEMENADRLKTVDKMVACFGPEEAVKIKVGILKMMNQNNLAEQLENKHNKNFGSLSLLWLHIHHFTAAPSQKFSIQMYS
uniref:Pyrin domain-containing protein n=1 Tax=Cyprinus carpio carpio TaxID=630221 RepID=A0A8C1EKC8_CYPCA